jgi:uncharacterized protein involved in exopolysaccharide biosynthesis
MTAPNTSFDDEISFAELVTKISTIAQMLWAARRMIAIRMGLVGIIGLIIAFGSPVEYSASMRLLPYRGGGATGGAGLSGLAGLAGIRLPTGANDQTITADLYPEVAKSLDFRIAVAETPLRFSALDRQVSTIEYFRNIRRPALTEIIASYSIGLPGRLLSSVNLGGGKVAEEPKENPKVVAESTVVRMYDQSYLSLVGTLGRRLSVSMDKKTGILVISGTMPDRYAAADLVRASADRLMQRIIEYESQKAGQNFRFVNEQYLQAKGRYERAQRDLASFSDRNRALMSATSQIDRDRLQREYDIAFEVYQQFSRELEQARIKMNQDTPVFTVLDQVTVPNIKAGPNRAQIMLVALLLGMIAGIAQLWMRQALRSSTVEEVVEHTRLMQ